MHIFGRTDRLDREAWLLLLMSGLFAIASALSSSFVNIYLWKLKNDWILISWFNTIHYGSAAATFVLAGWMTKHIERVIAIRLGVAGLSVFYLSVLWLGTKAVDYIFWLGILMGVGSGFFWLAFNVLYFEITDRKNRDVFNGVNGFLTSVAGIVAPFISGYIISHMGKFAGYRIIFAVSLAIFISAVMVSFFFKSRRTRGEYQLLPVLKLAGTRGSNWYWVSLAMAAQGLREGIFTFLISLLVFVVTKNEWELGGFFTVQSAVSCLGFFIVSRYMKPALRYRFLLIGAAMMGILILPLVVSLSSGSLWILGVGAAFFYPFYAAPLMASVFDVIGATERAARRRIECVVSRELALNLGRITGILFFIWWMSTFPNLFQIRWFVLIIGFTQLLAWLSIRHVPVGTGEMVKKVAGRP